MASRYWVGGTGTWDGTNTTNWSATSGGAGGASVPTTTDDVFFDSNSGSGTTTNAATMNTSIKSINFTGWSGTFAGSAFRFSCTGGNIVLGSTATLTTLRIQLSPGTGVSATISGSQTIGEFYLNPATATSTAGLGSNISCEFCNVFGAGTANLSNYNITCSRSFTINDGYTGTYNLGTGTITTGFGSSTNVAMTFNSASDTATTNSSSVNLVGSSTATNNIYLNGKTVSSISVTSGGALYIRATAGTTGSLTYTNNNASTSNIYLYANITITGLLTIGKTGAGAGTISVLSDVTGTQRTISAGSISLNAITWKDIIASGTASPFYGNRFINNGNNTNILFQSPYALFFGGNF